MIERPWHDRRGPSLAEILVHDLKRLKQEELNTAVVVETTKATFGRKIWAAVALGDPAALEAG